MEELLEVSGELKHDSQASPRCVGVTDRLIPPSTTTLGRLIGCHDVANYHFGERPTYLTPINISKHVYYHYHSVL